MGISQPVTIVGISVSNTASQQISYLLDGYNINAAYSLRKLTSNNTPLVKVRRSTDNLTQDFTNIANIASYVGAGIGYVDTWYDQGPAGRHATQPVTSAQPIICSAGSLIMLSGYPSILFNSPGYLSTSIDIGSSGSRYGILTTTERLGNVNRAHFGGATNCILLRNGVTGLTILKNNVSSILSNSDTTTGIKIVMACYDGSLTRMICNGVAEVTTASQVSATVPVTRIGAGGTTTIISDYLSAGMTDCIFLGDNNGYPDLQTKFQQLYNI